MFIGKRRSLAALLVLVVGVAGIGVASPALAFDPFTVAAVVSAGANAISSLSDNASEVAASADAFSDLYSEIDPDSSVSEDGQRLVDEVHEIEDLAYEAGYTKEEVEQLTSDAKSGKDAKTLSTTLRAITRAVRAGKRVARLFAKLQTKAQIAQVEQTDIERQQLIALYKQIRLQHEAELNVMKDKLEELKDKRDQIRTLKKEEKNAGAMTFGHTGVLTFPRQDSVIEQAIQMASGMRPYLLRLLLFVFLARSVLYQFGLFGNDRFGMLIRDAILCALLLMIFPELVRASVTLCNGLAVKIGMKELHDVQPGKLDFPVEIGFGVKSRLVFEWLFQWIKYLAYITARFLANFGLAFLILILPIVIFCSQMLGFAVAWPIFLGGFLSVCLWPLFWNATGSIALMLWRKDDASVSDQIATILFSILQFLSPLIGVACLKGQPLSKAVGSAGRAVSGALTSGVSTVVGQATGFVKGSVGAQGGATMGRVLAYPINQGAGRVLAAGLRGRDAAKVVPSSAEGAANGTKTSVGKVLRAAAVGFVTNHAQAPERTGLFHSAKQVAHGLKHRPVLHGALSGNRPSRGAPEARKTGGTDVGTS